MISDQNEIEAKLAADHVNIEAFKKWMFTNRNIEKFVEITSPDTYYEQGDRAVRQRGDDDDAHHELTIKLRKNENSTRDRVEIYLKFSPDTSAFNVRCFLEAAGFKRVFTLTKTAHIFWVRHSDNFKMSYVIYDVWKVGGLDKPRRFIEVEAEKGSNVTVETAKRRVREAVRELRDMFALGEPLNDSLYEIYSGKKYQVQQ